MELFYCYILYEIPMQHSSVWTGKTPLQLWYRDIHRAATSASELGLIVWKKEKQYLILINMLTFSQKLEWQTLSMVRGLSDQMRAACFNVVSSAQGLPSTVQQQLTSARNSAEELYSSLGSSSSFTPVLVERSRHQLTQVISALPILSASFKA